MRRRGYSGYTRGLSAHSHSDGAVASKIRVFDSAEAAVNHKPVFLNDAAKAMYEGCPAGGCNWAGFPSNENTIEAWRTHMNDELLHGWPEGARLMAMAKAQIVGALKAPRDTRLRASGGHVVGHSPNVGRALAGHPDVFRRWERCAKPAAVSIYVNLQTSGSVPAADLVWRGAAVIILADLYEAAGYRVEIWAVAKGSVSLSKVSRLSAARIKRSDDPMIPDYLAATVVSPRFYRAAMLLNTAAECMADEGLGMPQNTTAADLEAAGLPPASVMIGQSVLSMSAAVATINATIEKLGADE